MIRTLVTRLLALIFMILAVIHFYWAGGGQWGFRSALPTDIDGGLLLQPTAIDSLIVGLGFTAFGLTYLFHSYPFRSGLIRRARNIALWLIPLIFLARAIGDFQYVGFFKKVKATDFAQMDTMLFSPLCLCIGLLGLMIVIFKKS